MHTSNNHLRLPVSNEIFSRISWTNPQRKAAEDSARAVGGLRCRRVARASTQNSSGQAIRRGVCFEPSGLRFSSQRTRANGQPVQAQAAVIPNRRQSDMTPQFKNSAKGAKAFQVYPFISSPTTQIRCIPQRQKVTTGIAHAGRKR